MSSLIIPNFIFSGAFCHMLNWLTGTNLTKLKNYDWTWTEIRNVLQMLVLFYRKIRKQEFFLRKNNKLPERSTFFWGKADRDADRCLVLADYPFLLLLLAFSTFLKLVQSVNCLGRPTLQLGIRPMHYLLLLLLPPSASSLFPPFSRIVRTVWLNSL